MFVLERLNIHFRFYIVWRETMPKMKMIPLIAVLGLMLGFLFFVPTSYATNATNSSNEIERVEIGENSKTIYYKDGGKEMFVTCSVTTNIGISAEVAHWVTVITPPSNPIGFLIKTLREIFGIIKQFADLLGVIGLGGALLAWRIWNQIKSLRGNRPPDYYGVGTIFK